MVVAYVPSRAFGLTLDICRRRHVKIPGEQRGLGMDALDVRPGRRALFVSGGLAFLGAMAAGAARSADSPVEAANVDAVRQFCDALSEDSPEIERIVGRMMTDDCLIRFADGVHPASGRVAAIALLKRFFGNDERYELKIQDVFAHGPVVAVSRIDSTVKDRVHLRPTPVVGVFIMHDGKIREWSDYA